ncbi:aspartate dehydrogenase domain-containing protein-like [Sycon ciliatum]|uniref:aspartate dehydrogenase domain-containing protein-like n=1 Tax=Sycon ciliatum TaxID=27933 RepID=UPI0020A8C87B|eukprot:scpid92001/ scgid13045/ Putative L-aspartate dehydrogenase; Aspartate dehydrogenase domain-containing protein
MESSSSCRRVGIVGFGNLGKYLADQIAANPDSGLQIAFVWNRTPAAVLDSAYASVALEKLEDFRQRNADLIVEVAHPDIVRDYGAIFLQSADLMVGSPTACASQATEDGLRKSALENKHTVYIPSGALWGANDILKLATQGKLTALCITMKKHPKMLKVTEPLRSLCDKVTDTVTELYSGDVRSLCPLAPNNVNTMAAAAMAAHNLGFDKVQGRLLADPHAADHVITVDVTGPIPASGGLPMTVQTVRTNPAIPGAVTGLATYISFYSSLLLANNRPVGVQFV